jgi:hypothetical protein
VIVGVCDRTQLATNACPCTQCNNPAPRTFTQLQAELCGIQDVMRGAQDSIVAYAQAEITDVPPSDRNPLGLIEVHRAQCPARSLQDRLGPVREEMRLARVRAEDRLAQVSTQGEKVTREQALELVQMATDIMARINGVLDSLLDAAAPRYVFTPGLITNDEDLDIGFRHGGVVRVAHCPPTHLDVTMTMADYAKELETRDVAEEMMTLIRRPGGEISGIRVRNLEPMLMAPLMDGLRPGPTGGERIPAAEHMVDADLLDTSPDLQAYGDAMDRARFNALVTTSDVVLGLDRRVIADDAHDVPTQLYVNGRPMDASYTPKASRCDLPPLGWICTRAAGHEGPCAAKQDVE